MPDAALEGIHSAVMSFVRTGPCLAFVIVALWSCSPSENKGRGPEMVPTSRGIPSVVEAGEAAEREPKRPEARAGASQDAERSEGAPPEPTRPLSELLEDARRDVLGLGRANVSNLKEHAARVLSALAAVVEAADHDRGARAQLEELEFEAERLRRASGASFAQAGWVRLGLLAALDALAHVVPHQGQAPEPLRDAARQAAEAIPERSFLSFHHAAIQDAARATVDAYALSLPGALPCSRPSDRTPESASPTANREP